MSSIAGVTSGVVDLLQHMRKSQLGSFKPPDPIVKPTIEGGRPLLNPDLPPPSRYRYWRFGKWRLKVFPIVQTELRVC
jgi:hypothetical protein